MVDAGCQCAYVADSAGRADPRRGQRPGRGAGGRGRRRGQVGFHGHQNLGLGVANSVLAAEPVRCRSTAPRGFGAGAGNTPTEVFAAVCDRLGISTGVDVLRCSTPPRTWCGR